MIGRHGKLKTVSGRASWRDYQDRLRLDRPERSGRLPKVFAAYAALGLLILATIYFLPKSHDSAAYIRESVTSIEPLKIESRDDLRQLLEPKALFNPPSTSVDVSVGGRTLRVETSLDLDLQEYLLKRMDRVNSRYIGIVSMEPDTGRILSLSGFNKLDPEHNPCIDNSYPAASIFKIVTASAAVEAAGLSPDSKLAYNGRKHTLYKSQMTNKTNRHTNQTTLRDSFAQSINPVFGKLGTLRLGRNELRRYAENLGFNRAIPFDLPLGPSKVQFSEEPYQWAEIASGFNRQTTLSPLHGAVMAATLLNGGEMVEPTLIDRITDPDGKEIYTRKAGDRRQVLSPETSLALTEMMTTTIRSGTARKSFRGYRRDKILSKLTIGGKTGSIFNKARDARFDWFVGFAWDKAKKESIAVSVVVAHVEYIGTRAAQYARMVIRQHFKSYFAEAQKSAAAKG